MSDLVDQLLQATSDPVAWKVAVARIKALEAALQKVVIQERRVAASTDMTRSAMREGAAELANQIDAALKGGGDA